MATRLSTVIAATPETDLAVVQEMAAQLESYILGGEVYRTLALPTPVHGEERVQSSGGDLLARLHKLSAQPNFLPPAQREALAEVRAKVEEPTSRLQVQYQALLLREARARLNSLRWFLDDCRENRRECRVQYPFEIRNRQRIAEIGKALDAENAATLTAQLTAIDQRLGALTAGSDFVWDASVTRVYPRNEYWYLYALPVGSEP